MIRNAFLAFAMNASNFVKRISNVTIVFFFPVWRQKWQRKVKAGHVVTPTCPFYNALQMV